ncbi:MAG: CpsD/CapB family tyrosine-protein kinase [Xanthomonadaceae bacterium]|nr:CpsD/CapB family tyrosine-protein kinase [Xanthomonadaceae bacterium]
MNTRATNVTPHARLRTRPEFTLAQLKQARKRIDSHVVSLTAPDSYEAEQYRKLRYVLEQLHGAGDGIGLVAGVTSPAPGDGKSLTALNLAGALAQDMGARILLVDADLRRQSSSLRERLALANGSSPGLVDAILNPELNLQKVVRRIAPLNLSFVLTGSATATPYEMLSSPRVGMLLDEARRDYDYVIVDAPPVVPVSDCRVLAKRVDGFLMVIAAHQTPRGMLAESLDMLGPEKIIGIVYNGGKELLTREYGYGYHGYGRPARHSSSTRDSWLQETESLFGWKRRASQQKPAGSPDA